MYNWEPFIGEALDCAKETSNPHDLYSAAASIVKKECLVTYLEQSLVCALHLSIISFQLLSAPPPPPPQ